MNIVLGTILFLTSNPCADLREVTPISNLACAESAVRTTTTATWADCEAYIFSNASSIELEALSRLELETQAGYCTWQIIGQSQSTLKRNSGPGLGWPDSEITFDSEEDAETAASMILEATGQGSR